MAKSVNKVFLLGTLGRDPEVRYVSNNTIPVARISLATDQRYKDDQGNWQDKTEWHTLVAWRRFAEIIGQYVKKGDRLCVEGHLQTSSWDDQKTGEKKYRTEIVVDDLTLLGGRNSQGNAAGNASTAQAGNGPSDSTVITDEDIPF